MSERFVDIEWENPMMFPVDMRGWLPEDHLVHFIVEAIKQINISGFKVNKRGSGSEQFPPEMMLSMLICSYVTGHFESRVSNDKSRNIYGCSFKICMRRQSAVLDNPLREKPYCSQPCCTDQQRNNQQQRDDYRQSKHSRERYY